MFCLGVRGLYAAASELFTKIRRSQTIRCAMCEDYSLIEWKKSGLSGLHLFLDRWGFAEAI